MRMILFGSVCLVIAASSHAADPAYSSAVPALRFQKAISLSQKHEEALVAAVLDADVYAAAQQEFADLRVQNSEGEAIPFLLRKSQELESKSIRRKTWTATGPELKPLDHGGLQITLELGDHDPQPNGLSLITPLHNFEQRVRIFTSTDGEDWELSGGETLIFDYSRYMDVRSDSVPFVALGRKHIRVVIDDVTSEQQSELLELTRRLRGGDESERTERVTIDRRPFRIDRIEFYEEANQQSVKADRKLNYAVAGFKVGEDHKKHQTIVEIETRREPLTSLTLESSSKNFSRHCVVEVQDQQGTQTTWRQVGSATLSRIEFKNLKREQLTISFPETRQSRYRLVIDNRDSASLNVSGVSAEGNVYEVVFLAAGQKLYHLLYGEEDPDLERPNYDTAALQALLTERFSPETVTLGSEEKLSGAKPARWQLSHLLNDPATLTIIIGLLVILLGWGLYGAVKRIDAEPPSADAGS